MTRRTITQTDFVETLDRVRISFSAAVSPRKEAIAPQLARGRAYLRRRNRYVHYLLCGADLSLRSVYSLVETFLETTAAIMGVTT